MTIEPPREPYSYCRDPAVPAFPDDKPIIVFDGHCAMCSGWARRLLKSDRSGRYRLLPAQTPLGRALYVHYGLDPVHFETNILIENGRAYVKAESSIRVAKGLDFPFALRRRGGCFRAPPWIASMILSRKIAFGCSVVPSSA